MPPFSISGLRGKRRFRIHRGAPGGGGGGISGTATVVVVVVAAAAATVVVISCVPGNTARNGSSGNNTGCSGIGSNSGPWWW